MAKSSIEWTEETYNPIVGCTRISPGCQHCYAERMAKRLIAMGQEKYQGTIDQHGRWTGVLNFDNDNWEAPLKRKRPTTYFVNSMSDLFHPDIPPNWLIRIFLLMGQAHWHTFQVLTKRADVMAERAPGLMAIAGHPKNIWLGVSVENQQYADERIPHLLQTPAAIKFLSCEPLLGPVDLKLLGENYGRDDKHEYIDWVIVGGESGPAGRPMDLAWALSLVDQCYRASVPCFVKQLGANPIDGPMGHKTGYPISDRKGKNMADWPSDLRVREFPQVAKMEPG